MPKCIGGNLLFDLEDQGLFDFTNTLSLLRISNNFLQTGPEWALNFCSTSSFENGTVDESLMVSQYDRTPGPASGPLRKNFLFDRANFDGRSPGNLVRTKSHVLSLWLFREYRKTTDDSF